MKFEFKKDAWMSIEEGEKNCYLVANGLGGYNSMNLVGGLTRGDQALFMAAKKAPNVRWNMITGVLETLTVDGTEYVLTSQRMQEKPDLEGFQYLESFTFDNYPEWVFRIGDVTVNKKIVMVHGENTVAMQYEISKKAEQQVSLMVTPLLRVTAKNTAFEPEDAEKFTVREENSKTADDRTLKTVCGSCYQVIKGEDAIYFATNGTVAETKPTVFGPLYFSQDERDGRDETGFTVYNHTICLTAEQEQSSLTCVFSTKPTEFRENYFEAKLQEYKTYINSLMEASKATTELGKQLAVSADAYVSERESTRGKTILAGFPFFEDWGRDTMIALPGITMVTGRFEECKSILRTFAKYVHHGLLPNLFPEGDCNPMYNSVDAPLLFINTVYEYIKFSGDEAFLPEIFPVLEPIVEAYKTGTDFHIKMDADCLIQAGADLEQLTWMDVRVGDHLPTPRHGKPVEINAYWYSALKVMEEFARKLGKAVQAEDYASLAERVKEVYLPKFWNEAENCLKDVLSGNSEENQVRCNQIWALTQPFTMLDAEHEKAVIEKVRAELYTTIGLRTLSPKDPAFHEIYIGPVQQRDRAYHQGTTWAFPLGAYYRACIRYIKQYEFAEKEEWKKHVKDGIQALEQWLGEGCVAQIAEIYDGGTPTISRGCYAQAWSVGELLRAVYDLEQLERN
ncbi:MAG: glycogen debranching enzyme family protein [Lachnospiraceae bacterium]|nr:glycogen debranching enzyme family protein [Lachnospiraceae bacterium]